MSIDLKVSIPNLALNLGSISQSKGHFSVGSKTQFAEDLCRYETVHCAGINQKLNGNFPA